MQQPLEVFFDYACPYCYKAHGYLTALLPKYPNLSVVWCPCEAHPRPERYGPHSDLCIQGYFYALENGVDVLAYHDRMFRAVWQEHVDIENIDTLADYVHDLVEADAFRLALRHGTYANALAEANARAFERSGVWVVPAYRMGKRKLDAVAEVGVTEEQLRTFLDSCVEES